MKDKILMSGRRILGKLKWKEIKDFVFTFEEVDKFTNSMEKMLEKKRKPFLICVTFPMQGKGPNTFICKSGFKIWTASSGTDKRITESLVDALFKTSEELKRRVFKKSWKIKK